MRPIIVGGAGIGGLTAGLASAAAGFPVRVLERRPGLAEFGAGLQLSPNATRVLADLKLLDAVERIATKPEAIRIRRGHDGTALAVLPIGSTALKRYGAPFLLVHRADLQRVLVEASHGVEAFDLDLGTAVESVRPDPDGVVIHARVHQGACSFGGLGFVDAGGLHASRDGFEPVHPAWRVAWRALVPAETLPAAFARKETNLWLGSRAHLVHYPLRSCSLINVVAITQAVGPSSTDDGDLWSEPGDPDELRRAFAGWHRDVEILLRSTTDWRRWPLFDAPPLASWGSGPVTRLGDAAHPMLPFLAQGASQAIEDAGALGAALRHADAITAAFRLYEQRRAPRAARVQRASRRQGAIYHLARPASDARDLVMRCLGGPRALARMDWLYAPA